MSQCVRCCLYLLGMCLFVVNCFRFCHIDFDCFRMSYFFGLNLVDKVSRLFQVEMLFRVVLKIV